LGYVCSIETHGDVSIASVSKHARIIMDIKTPGSGMHRSGYLNNLPLLKPSDEIKFVVTSEADLEFMQSCIDQHQLNQNQILVSPVQLSSQSPQQTPKLCAQFVAQWILERGLQVRLQVQLHKAIWGDIPGV
jgi:7-carboxy-7-deazaguanine synthase